MKKFLVLIYLFYIPCAFSKEGGSVNIVNELGEQYKLSKSDWPRMFTCNHYGGVRAGQFMFSIRKSSKFPLGLEDSWLIFSDFTAYSGELYRNGLDWRIDWTDKNTSSKFSLTIKSNGESYYYNWALADEGGRLHVEPSIYWK